MRNGSEISPNCQTFHLKKSKTQETKSKWIGMKMFIQLRAFDYIRLPFYEAKVLFSEGRGRM